MRIALDAMGGDHAPAVVIDGAVRFAHVYPEVEVILVGKQDMIEAELKKHKTDGLKLSVVHAPDVVEMHEHTMAVKEKKDASMNVAARMVRKGEADAFTTAGNTGAALAAALFNIGRIKGIDRPALGTVYPAAPNKCLILDVGANTDLQPENLLQFAIMGNIYAEDALQIPRPRLGIISNGEEEDKGSMLTRETQKLLRVHPRLNYIGNVEGKDLPKGIADVVVTDGFVGNVIIKLTEGIVSFLMRQLKREFTAGALNKLGLILLIPGLILMLPGFILLSPAMRRVWKRVDWREYGGAPLLGVNGVVVIGHGRSDAKAIFNMIRMTKVCVEGNVVEKIRAGIEGQGSGGRDAGSGVRDQGSGVRDQGSGVRDQGSGVRGQGSEVRDQPALGSPGGSEGRDQGSGIRGPGSGIRGPGSGIRGPGIGRRVSGIGFWGSGRRMQELEQAMRDSGRPKPDARCPTPETR